jgi:hypothetical protein
MDRDKQGRERHIHFGVLVVADKYGLRLSRNNYANAEADFLGTEHYAKCMENFDLNMVFYKSLDPEKFEKKLNAFLKRHTGFKPVADLNELEEVSGYYLMVLDEYKQVYIGTSDNIKKRIQTHWRIQKKFDRLLFGSAEESRLSIDSFRALDTTRIYAYKTWNTYDKEDKYLAFFPDEYVCNRIAGGKMELGTLQAFGTRKKREFIQALDETK